MASILSSDVREQSTFKILTTGEKATRAFLVQVNSSTPGYGRMLEAGNCPGIPRIGDLHPSDSDLAVSLIEPSCKDQHDTSVYLVLVHYEVRSFDNTPAGTTAFSWVTCSASVENQEQFVDKDGNQLLVPFSGAMDGLDQPNSAQVTVCNAIVTMVRREPAPMNLAKVLTLVGAVNSRTWLNGAPRTWKCVGVEPQWDGKLIKWTYKFQYNRNTWDVVCFYKDPITRNVVQGALSEGDGFKTFRIYTEVDFNLVPLP